MPRIAIMIHLAGCGTAPCGTDDSTGEPTLYASLSQARAELQTHLKDVKDAVAQDEMEDDHNVADYFLYDTKTSQAYSVVWGPGQTDLLVVISHETALSSLATAIAAGGADSELAFQLDVAKTAAEFGCADHRNTVVVLLPSQDGPQWDKHAIAPSSMSQQQALEFVDHRSALAKDLQAAIDMEGWDDDGLNVADRIDLYLEEAGFTVLSGDQGNLRVAQVWDRQPDQRDEEGTAPAL